MLPSGIEVTTDAVVTVLALIETASAINTFHNFAFMAPLLNLSKERDRPAQVSHVERITSILGCIDVDQHRRCRGPTGSAAIQRRKSQLGQKRTKVSPEAE